MAGKYEIDMTKGPILSKILLFSLPLMAMSILQLLFNATDIIVIGRFGGSHRMAAIGSTSSLYNLIVNIFVGLSTGACVIMARYSGAKEYDKCKKTVSTSVLLSLISGFILIFIGIILAPKILILMGTPEEILPHSVLYLRIIFLGMPLLMLYNFSSGILRAVGDTRRPLYYLLIGGVLNVILNLFFVIVLRMGVEGVAIGTIASELLSAILTTRCLIKDSGADHLDLKDLSFDFTIFKQILRVGLPVGVQSATFSVSNVVIQSSINSFGAIAVAGSAAAQNIDGFVYAGMNSVFQATISFTSQNYGAGNKERILKVLYSSLIVVSIIGILMGGLATLFGHTLLSIYSSDASVIEYGYIRMVITLLPFFFCGLMEVVSGAERGIGIALIPTLSTFFGSCLLRIVWVYTVFRLNPLYSVLFISYPASWIVTFIIHLIFFSHYYKKLMRKKKRFA